MFFRQIFDPDAGSPLVKSAFADVSAMLDQAAEMLDHSLEVLLDNKPIRLDFEQLDDVIDEAERRVRRTILQHLAVNPKQDLVASLVLVSMVQDAERIGDFARGLVELMRMAKGPRQGPFADELRRLAQQLRPLFPACERAFREANVQEARWVITQHRQLRAELKAYRDRVAASELSADMAVVYAGAAQILRRVGAHLSNIASTVVQPYDRIRHGDEEL
ncbi:MAG TPA: PhoU domain-containing protein [Vicinamibacterales bacterium]|nr:PhoU domain-containing protein [Vicinamibacterales bacterium]